mgnify:CR=1 FL=1
MIASYTYTYSDGFVGGYNQISKTETKNGASAETTAYEYDAWGRLIKVTHPSGTVNAYTYDKAGNRLSKVSSKDGIIATNVYSYDEQNRLTETVATTNGSSAEVHTYFGYDNNGNQISKWVQSVGVSDGENSVTLGELGVNAAGDMALYSYDNFNRLTGILQGNTTIQNAYNGRGRKISRTTDGETRYYVYDGNTVIAELDGQNELKARNVYGRNLISRTTDKPMIMSYNGHGDIVLVKSVSGETLAEYAYDEFGNVLAQNGELDNPYRYAGYEYLDSVDLYDLNARYYNPKTARFLSEDPYFNLGNRVIGLYEINVPSVLSVMQANALYVYCGNAPVKYADASGYSIFLTGTEEEREISFSQLQKLTDDTLTYDSSTGWVTIETFSTNVLRPDGTKLVSDLILNNEFELTISRFSNEYDGCYTDYGTNGALIRMNDWAEKAGYDWYYMVWEGDNKLKFDESTKTFSSKGHVKAEPHGEVAYIILGHELVHATHHMNNDFPSDSLPVRYFNKATLSFEDDYGEMFNRAEEYRTTGISYRLPNSSNPYKTYRPEGITENSLRAENGLRMRIIYE